jgi:RNA polymerase sigma factor (sigma-70 family)
MPANRAQLLRRIRGVLPPLAGDEATDAALLERFVRARDEDAFAHLVSRHARLVFGVCRRVVRDAHSAEDVAQAAFLVLARQAGCIRLSGSLAGWLHRTARRLALKHSRGETRRRQRETRYLQPSADPHPDPLDELSVRELLAICDAEIDRLPERYRLPLVLCCLEGRTHQEAAGQLGWTAGSVKGRLERGRELLRRRLVRRGLTFPAVLVGLELMRGTSPAGLPASFIAGTSRAAVLFVSPGGGMAAGLDRGVAELAETGLRSMGMIWTRMILSLVLVAGVVAAGVAALRHSGETAEPPPARQAELEKPAKDQAGEKPRRDRHGDPLPRGAIARLGTLRWRALGEVEALAFSSDGKTVAAASVEGIRFFDSEGRVTRQVRIGDTSHFEILGISPDGKRLARACEARQGRNAGQAVVQIWELANARKVQEFPTERPPWVGWSADGEPVALFQKRGTLLFRELATGRELSLEEKTLRRKPGLQPPELLDFSHVVNAPHGRVLAALDQRGVFHVWDTGTGRERRTLERKNDPILSTAISSDGRVVAWLDRTVADKQAAHAWDLTTGRVRHDLAGDQEYIESLLFSPGGKTLATVGTPEVRFLDAVTGRERGRTRPESSLILITGKKCVALSPDGRTFARVDAQTRTLQLWDVASGERKPSPAGHSSLITQAAFSPDGRRVVSGSCHSEPGFIWDSTTGEPLSRFGGLEDPRTSDFSADGRRIFSVAGGEALDVVDADTGRTLQVLKVRDPDRPERKQMVGEMKLSQDRKRLVTLSASDLRADDESGSGLLLTGWDATTLQLTFRRRRSGSTFWPLVSPDARVLAYLPFQWRGPVHLENLTTGEHLLALPEFEGRTRPLAFSTDGRLLATFSDLSGRNEKTDERPDSPSGTVRLQELASGREVLALATTNNARVAFSPDRQTLALTSDNKDILLWDLRRGRALRRFQGFESRVISLAFSPDGLRLVSGLEDSTLLVWDTAIPKAAKPAPPDAMTLKQAWADLAGDPKQAFAVRWMLAQWPTETVAFLKERLQPIRSADPALLRQLVADLDSETFAVREKAQARLEELGDRARGALREALGRKPSLEARRRLEGLLARWRGPIRDTEVLRAVRAIAVLEDIGTAEARAVLKTLAGGVDAARQTQEALEALERASRGREQASPGSGGR